MAGWVDTLIRSVDDFWNNVGYKPLGISVCMSGLGYLRWEDLSKISDTIP